MARKNANANQIIRKDGNNCFVEVLRNSFEIGRVLMKFVTYDLTRPSGDKFTNEIDIYLTFEQFFRLSYDILDSQSLIKAIQKDKQEATAKGSQYPQQRVIAQGGTSAESLAQKGKSRPDGMGESRILKIFAGNKLPIMFVAEKGAGEADSKGLIVPRYGRTPDSRVMMGLSADDAKELFLYTREEVRAFITAKRMMELMNPAVAPIPQASGNNNGYRPAPVQTQPRAEAPAPATVVQPSQPVQQNINNAMNKPEPPSAPLFDDDFPIDDDLFGGSEDFFG